MWAYVFLAGVMVVGCAATQQAPLAPSEAIRTQLGTIGLILAPLPPEIELLPPSRAECVARLAGGGFLGGLMLMGLAGPAAPVAPLMGLSIGVFKGATTDLPPAKVVSEAEFSLQKILDAQASESKIPEAIREHVFQIARAQIPHTFALLSQEDHGADTLLEINVPQLRLPCTCGRCFVEMAAHVRLIQAQGGKELYTAAINRRSGTKEFTEWASDDGELLQKELDLAVQQLAKNIVEIVFLLDVIP